MILIDTSLWLAVYRDRSGSISERVQRALGGEEYVLCQFVRAEILRGCRDQAEWTSLTEYLDDQVYRELSLTGWNDAARLYFDLRQKGITVRSAFDCCISALALEHDLTLLHNDRDYEKIATVRPLQQRRLSGLEPFGHG